MGPFLTTYALGDALQALSVAALLIGMRRRGLYQRHRIFVAYLGTILAANVAMIPLLYPYLVAPMRYPWFFYVSWPSDFLTTALGVVVILEIYVAAFAPYESFRGIARAMFRWATALLLLLAAFLAWQTHTADGSHVMFVLLVVKRSLRIVQTGLLIILFACWAWLRLPRRNMEFGIALGYGAYAAVELITLAARTALGPVDQQVFQIVTSIDYLVPAGIWAVYVFSRPAPEQFIVAPARKLDEWNQDLGEMLRR